MIPPGSDRLTKQEGGQETPSDEELLAIMARPDSKDAGAAGEELFGRYSKRVYLWCLRYVKDHDAALDLAQDSLMSAFRSIESFQGRSRFSSWLFAITRNRCLSSLRPVSLLRDDDRDPDSVASPDDPPLQQLTDSESEASLLKLIRTTLEPIEQKVIWFRCFEKMPVDQITGMLAIEGASGARGIIQRARRKLRAALKKRPASEENEQ